MKETIAFCGDSYCADIASQELVSWPDLIANVLNIKIVSRGVKGTPFYSAYKQVNRAIDLEINYIIICITHYSRLANLYDLSVMPNRTPWDERKSYESLIRMVGSAEKAKEINLACKLYYEYLYKDEYHATVQKLFIESLDSRLLEHKKKVIWFHCDENSLSIPIKSGPCLNSSLYDVSIAELEPGEKFSDEEDKRRNHCNSENNQNMANLILDVIKNDSFTARLIRTQDYFLNV